MTLRAGFSEADITPEYFPVRTYFSSATEIIDPIFVHAAAFNDGKNTLLFLSLDVVIVETPYATEIKRPISEQRQITPANIMICATHNHACPAVIDRPGSEKEDIYLAFMVKQSVVAAIKALDSLEAAEFGAASGFEERISFNRRYIKKDGTVVTQPRVTPETDDILCHEGVIDPEIGVICVKNHTGKIIGMLVNFACHAVHHMGDLSAGYPGVLCRELKAAYGNDCVCVFLNGACGNVIHRNYSDPNHQDTKEKTGKILADDVKTLVKKLDFSRKAKLTAVADTVKIKYRDISGLEQNIDHLEAFNVFDILISKGWYKYSLEQLKQMHAQGNFEEATIQVFRIGDVFFGTVPCEFFAENALKIKARSPAAKTFVISLAANGWLGYIPHPGAFERRGGHETTWATWSKMEPAAGDIIVEKVLDLINTIK